MRRCDQTFFEKYPDAPLSPVQRLFCGGIAGITSVFLTYPLDIVRTRLSIQSASFAALGDRPKQLPGMWPTLVGMYKQEGGAAALYRGIIPTVAGVAPYVSAGLSVSYSSAWLRSADPAGRIELHDVRVRPQVPDPRGRHQPQRCPQAACWCRIGRRGADVHISLVS